MTDTKRQPIGDITELIERLEALAADLDASLLTRRQWEHVGWARRAVQSLLDQARGEADAIEWAEQYLGGFARVLPKAPRNDVVLP